MKVKSFLFGVAARATGNPPAQRWLKKLCNAFQGLQGIGTGGDVLASGEVAVISALRHKPERPLTVVDVSANHGQFLASAQKILDQEDYRIHSFEPAAATFRLLSNSYGTLPRMVLNNMAMGAEVGQAILWYDEEGSAGASLTRRDLSHLGRTFDRSEAVAVTTLDAYAEEKCLKRIDLLKLDVEGHELDVLQGAQRLLEARQIGAVLFEFGGCNVDTRTFVRDFWKVFEQYGMQMNRVTPNGYVLPLERYNESLEQFRNQMFVASHSPSRSR